MEVGSWPEERVLEEENTSKSPGFRHTSDWRWGEKEKSEQKAHLEQSGRWKNRRYAQ